MTCARTRAWRLLLQMLQVENYGVRVHVVKKLANTKGKSAGVALAQRAVFDLHPEVREAAVKQLKDRPRAESRSVLLEAFRYPWSAVADRAAEALVALDDRDAVVDLTSLLDKPDPKAPTQNKEKKWVVSEVVRVNHLGNCVLCHAPSTTKDDPMRGVVPERGTPLPEVYYESRSGSFVRADVTYLKQDFSLMQTVSQPNKWPSLQHFDYLVRQRELTQDEVSLMTSVKSLDTVNTTTYPQRDAVLWALRELTGQDLGTRSEDWYEYLSDEWMAHAP